MQNSRELSEILNNEIAIIEKELEHLQTYNLPIVSSILVTILFVYFLIVPSNLSLTLVENILTNTYPLAIILAIGLFVILIFIFVPLFDFHLVDKRPSYRKELYIINEMYIGIYLGLIILVVLLISYSSALILTLLKGSISSGSGIHKLTKFHVDATSGSHINMLYISLLSLVVSTLFYSYVNNFPEDTVSLLSKLSQWFSKRRFFWPKSFKKELKSAIIFSLIISAIFLIIFGMYSYLILGISPFNYISLFVIFYLVMVLLIFAIILNRFAFLLSAPIIGIYFAFRGNNPEELKMSFLILFPVFFAILYEAFNVISGKVVYNILERNLLQLLNMSNKHESEDKNELLSLIKYSRISIKGNRYVFVPNPQYEMLIHKEENEKWMMEKLKP